MAKGFTHARLACGCRITFREGVEGSPVTVVVDSKSPACTLALHVRDLPLYDYREALRPSTRLGPPEEEEFEEEGCMRSLRWTGAFTKDVKRLAKRGNDLNKLDRILNALQRNDALPPAARPHLLSG